MASATTDPPQKQLSQRIKKGNELLKRCGNLENSIEGLQKLKRKIIAELKFLNSLASVSEPLKYSCMRSTNLSFFDGVLSNAEEEKDVIAVLKPFCYVGANKEELNCVVDVVADGGCCWSKVTARNASALHWTWQGEGDFGDKDIVHQAKKLQEACKQHPWNFSAPRVMLFCCNGITESLAYALTSIGVKVKGIIVADPGKELSSSCFGQTFVHERPCSKQCNCVNLDITTMIALVSSLTNGGCGHVFKEPILTEQAKQERQKPVIPKLKTFLQGKELLGCDSAVRDFQHILKTVGGVQEQERARVLLGKMKIVDDNPSTRSSSLQPSASIKERSKVIFGTGDSIKAITATANVAFTRAAASQGVEFSVFIHESRALTERKEYHSSVVYELV